MARINTHTAWIAALSMALTGCLSTMGQAPDGPVLDRLSMSPQFEDGLFVNEHPVEEMDLNRLDRMLTQWWEAPETETPVDIPLESPAWASDDEGGAKVTWLGHSTVMIELDGVRVLTDPIWSERCSPVSFAGPKRFHPPAVSLDALGKVDAVIISHDHYDHLDYETVMALSAKGVPFYVPLGVGSHLASWGVETWTELDWWQSAAITNARGERVELVATPAQHFSGRGLSDRNTTLWASWAVVGPRQRAFFGGDTGYFDGFAEIGEKLGPFDVTMMPIGAYNKLWASIHMDPEEAIKAHADVRGRDMLPIHWGTFNLALHPWDEPADRFRKAAERVGIRAHIPKPGQTIRVGDDAESGKWWQAAL